MRKEFWECGLLGTARRPFDPTLIPTEIGDIVTSSNRSTDASRYLAAAAAVSIRSLAGRKAIVDAVPVDAAPGDSARECSPVLADIVDRLIDASGHGLLEIAGRKMAAAGQRLPHRLLPKALAIVDPSRRESLLPILGDRGAWLARRIAPDHWAISALSRAAPTDPAAVDAIWSEGSADARYDLLREMRRRDPDAARERLAAVFKSEKADVREAFVAILGIGLSLNDEPFLNVALKDRAVGVRAAAAHHLVRLPDSAVARRRRSAAEKILSVQKDPLSVTVTMPDAFDVSWAADGLVETPPSYPKIGPRAFWTRQILSSVPPRFFCDKFGITPADLIAAVLTADFPDVIEAFAVATSIFFDRDFYDALVDQGVAVLGKRNIPIHESTLRTLIAGAPRDIADRKLVEISKRAVDPGILLGLFAHQFGEWSEDLAIRFLELAQNADPTGRSFQTVVATINDAAMRIPDSVLDRALEGWTKLLEAKDLPTHAATRIQGFVEAVHMRRVIAEETKKW